MNAPAAEPQKNGSSHYSFQDDPEFEKAVDDYLARNRQPPSELETKVSSFLRRVENVTVYALDRLGSLAIKAVRRYERGR